MSSSTDNDIFMPTRSEIEVFYTSLFGSDIVVRDLAADKAKEQYVIAEYREPCGRLRYVIAIDYGLANALGAALTVIPPAVARESADKEVIPDNIRENLQEVMNVCTSLFSVGMNGHHLAIGELFEKGSVTEAVMTAMQDAVEVDYYEVDVPRYQAGTMSVFRMEPPEEVETEAGVPAAEQTA